MVSISLCMIVKDEEAVLERCLEAASKVVDEICIVDTGSSDRTLEIARAKADKFAEFAWCDDFSAARNASLKLATGDWILVLDADEVITGSAREELERFTRTAEAKGGKGHAGQVRIDDAPHPEAGMEASLSWVTRFFPRSENPNFTGHIHEQLQLNSRPPMRARMQVTVLHDGYTAAGIDSKDKLKRNVRMLSEALAQNKADPYLWWQLGRTHAVSGDHESALDAFTSASDMVALEAPFLASLCEATCYSLRALERYEEALELIGNIAESFRDRADTVFLEALLSMDMGHVERADAGFRRCLQLAGTLPAGGPTSPSASTFAPAYNLGVLREVLGHGDEARAYYNQALEMEPGHTASQLGLERIAGTKKEASA